ncbi:MAG: cytochrome c biogenesis protein CcsA [Candidatus Limnocylindria bacterium]
MAFSTVLIAAALILLVASVGAAALIGAVGGLRNARLATASGTTVDLAGAPGADGAAGASRTIPWRSTAHLGVLGALAVLTAALAARTLATGHAPWSNLHEFSTAFAAAVLAVYSMLERRAPIRGLAPLVALVGAGLLAFALTLDDRIDPLVPALQQPLLLTVHVGAAVAAYAVSAVAFAAAAGELIQRRARDSIGALPDEATCRAVAHRAVLLAFPILTAAIALGSVWANLAWRSYWSNDPKELAAAATWFVFGAYLHVAGRRDRWATAAPWLIVLGFAGVLFTYLGAGLIFVGEHSYAAP